jgi:dipeptidyl-peptidase-4
MFRFALALVCAAAPMSAAAQTSNGGTPRLTPERVFADPDLNGPRARGLAFSPDGRRVTYLRPKADDQDVLDLWAADIAGGEPRLLVDSRKLSPDARTLSEAEKARRERARVSARGIVDYDWDREGRSLLVPLDGDLFLADAGSGSVRRLTQTPGDEVDARVSPRGGYVSFVRDQNLHVLDLAGGGERALTTGRRRPDRLRRRGVHRPGRDGPLHGVLVVARRAAHRLHARR